MRMETCSWSATKMYGSYSLFRYVSSCFNVHHSSDLKWNGKCIIWQNESQTAKELVKIIEEAENEYQVVWASLLHQCQVQNAAFTWKKVQNIFVFCLILFFRWPLARTIRPCQTPLSKPYADNCQSPAARWTGPRSSVIRLEKRCRMLKSKRLRLQYFFFL